MDINDFKTSRFNIVGDGSSIKGELHLCGQSSIAGHVEGRILAAEGSRLVIEKTSVIVGEIHGHDVEVHGRFEGELKTLGTLTLKPGCIVSGTIKANRLVVYPGAVLNSETTAG